MTGTAIPAPWLSLIGIGEDGKSGLSAEPRARLGAATLVVGGRRHLELAVDLIRGTPMPWRSPIEDTLPDILARRGQAVCILATGDPFHYGVGTLMARHVAIGEMRCWPQPSAFSLAAARLGWSLEDCRCMSVHGRALDRIVPLLRHGERLLVLSWDGSTPAKMAALLASRGFGASQLWVCEAMGGPTERMRDAQAAGFDLGDVQALNTVAVCLRADPEAWQMPVTSGLPDDWFSHDGQITKAPVRAVTLSALAPRPGECLWDIGAGSGSIGIEWLLAHESTRAFAVERDETRAARVVANAVHWGVAERLHVVRAVAPEGLTGLPPPDAIFIGGGLTAPGLVETVQAALKPRGRLVANAVTVESQAMLSFAFGRDGGDLLTLAFARAEPVGGFHSFKPAMPITQWRWSKP